MKSLLFSTTLFLLVSTAAGPASAQTAPAPATTAPAPRIEFASTVFDFGRAAEGEIIEHDFVFTNTGNATLEITGVHGSCNCTTAGEWTRQVPPGGTGIIPLQFNTTRFPGAVVKTATVVHNDPTQPMIQLQIKGTVWRPFDVSPPTVVLNILPESDSNAPAVVRIVSNLEEPVTLGPPECNNQTFTAKVETVRPGKEFQVVVNAVPPFKPGASQGTLTIRTSVTNSPVLHVPMIAMVRPALTVNPQQIVLPATHAPTYAVTIRNNTANPMTVSDPKVNAPGVDVQLKEVEPGKQFTLTLTFSPEFSSNTNNCELTFKTSHPDYPSVRVPVRRLSTAARAPVAPTRPAAPATNATLRAAPQG